MSSVFGGGQSQPATQTVYVPYQTPAAATAAPAPPPNPPLLGSAQKPLKGQQTGQQFSASVIGSLPTGQPTRTLLGTASA